LLLVFELGPKTRIRHHAILYRNDIDNNVEGELEWFIPATFSETPLVGDSGDRVQETSISSRERCAQDGPRRCDTEVNAPWRRKFEVLPTPGRFVVKSDRKEVSRGVDLQQVSHGLRRLDDTVAGWRVEAGRGSYCGA